MAGTARYTAVLDACVMYPAQTRDALMSLAFEDLFSARWTTRIDHEWTRTLLSNRTDLTADRIQQTISSMRQAVPDWEVRGESYEHLIAALSLPDPDDRHVLAAAIAGHADCIVTSNLKDFPSNILACHGIEPLHPDDFIVLQLDLAPFAGLTAIKAMRARLRKPPLTVDEFIESFERAKLFATAGRLRQARELL